ncbi:energy-coupling factor transport system ATP-binding protein [Micromonospora phaseoli]|uniref:Energy-coupling factor transport system ATP-binding protein n=1 Tax=Micromonospora phaseoli TaxID=1144548 RepID=A0A1H7CGG6_9ACTN|nr:ABC transporter ATP-binding protein [Micromonospora phaseoli]PZV97806.1 energy-coupling factor transport system ATP-binding protein [Micromonospora phaseoli]GIJ78458.1 ABC transporter ATP-binding protein [Micromonospora phaseoli]SEJ88781.1 energy-coupling factor transport system ATP-binding protein [Micromonospora phaseoli]
MGGVRLRGFGWRHAGRRAWAVRGVDLRVERGERVLLLGPSGAGKSTLLAALAGLLPEDSGEHEGTIEIDGRPAGEARDGVGIVFQDPQTQLVMARSGDDVAFGLENRGVPAGLIWPRVDQALHRVGFPYHRDRPTAALSGGEQQRLALAGVLALRPGLLLLDEPTANLDPAGAALIRAALTRAVGDETTLILVEHRVADALPLVDRVVVLEPGGGVRADGAPEAIFAAHGDALAAEGVWVPGREIPPRRATGPAGEVLLTADRLGLPPRLAPTDLTVRAGETLAVLGRNGAGKSTLALLLGGLLKPGSGRLTASRDLAGKDTGTPPHRWRAPALAGRIGSVFQDPEHQFVTDTVRDELALGPRRAGAIEAAVGDRVEELLHRLRLARLAAANPYTLSGGEARRLSVATALATAPRLLICDEPTFGQDRRTWWELVDLFAELREAGHGLVTVTHDTEFVTALADRTLILGHPPAPTRGSGSAPAATADPAASTGGAPEQR